MPTTAARIGSITATKGKVTLTVSCSAAAGASCNVQSLLTSIEQKRAHKLVGVLARKVKTVSTKVTVGTAHTTIPANGRATIVIGLNATGRALIARFGKLPAHLQVTLAGGPARTIVSQNLTIKPPPKKKKKKKKQH